MPLKRATTLSRSLSSALLKAIGIACFVSILISTLSYLNMIERHIREDSSFFSELLFERAYSMMIEGLPGEKITEQLALHLEHVKDTDYDLLRSSAIVATHGGENEITTEMMQRIEQQNYLRFRDWHFEYIKPIRFDSRCVHCHTRGNTGDLAGILELKIPLFSIQLPFAFTFYGLIITVAITLFSTLLYLSWYARHHMVKPINRISDKLSNVNAHSDLVDFRRDEWRIVEFDTLEGAFHSQHGKLLSAYKELEQRAEIDPLTGTYNRFRLKDLLEGAISRSTRHKNPLTLALIDLNRFKEINDNHGHEAGDMALKRFARQLLKQTRSSDSLIRLGGDEFLLIGEECNARNAGHLFTRVREALNRAEQERPLGFSIDFSVGIVEYPRESSNSEALIKLADARMYEQKRQKRAVV